MAKGFLYDNGDELITREDVNEVPDSSTAHAGDVLSLDSNKKPKWSAPESELPSTGSASEGDVLSLNASKEPVWAAPSGGGGGIFEIELDIQSASDVISDGEGGYYYKTNSTIANTIGIGKIPVCGELVPGSPPTLSSPFFPISYGSDEQGDFITYNFGNGSVYLTTVEDHGETLYYHAESIG